MARNLGQTIMFEMEDVSRGEQWVPAQVTAARNSVSKITAFHGIRTRAREVAERNKIHSVYSKLTRATITIPKPLKIAGGRLEVLAGQTPPRIVEGYAKYDIVDRPSRAGLTHFVGYDPIVMEVPVWFEWSSLSPGGEPEGDGVEDAIAMLERMGGRGIGSTSAVGRPGRVRVTTERNGSPVPLIPASYQPGRQNPNPPAWVVSGIDWDDAPWRNKAGNRIRQFATVTLTQYISPVAEGPLSVTDRSRARNGGIRRSGPFSFHTLA
jgi:hypothetical protein